MQNLRRLPYLLAVEPPRLDRVSFPGRTALVVDVREHGAGRVEGGVGYASDPRGVGHGLTGRVAIDFPSFLGTGREVHASWGRRGPEASDLALRYREPWAFGYPLSGAFRLQVRERAGYVEDELGGSAAFSATPNLGVRVGLRRERVRPGVSERPDEVESRLWGVEAGVRYDTRDDRWNPRSGVLYAGTFSWGMARQGDDRRSRREYAVAVAHVLPTGRRSVTAVSVQTRGVMQGGGVPVEARLPLGGSTTIRGYREEAFLATQASWMSLEWRLLLGRRSRAFLFCDAGVLRDPGSDGDAAWIFLVGYGAGLRVESRLGVIGLDYGLSREERPGQGKMHLRVANAF